jgi:4-diphosphocytidyl-2-C-methyl-D-erythritol kinase
MVFLHKNLNMVVFPKAKINIGLRIIEKRPDGFHNLQTIFYPVCLCDALEFVDSERLVNKDKLIVTGLLSDSIPEENLVIKAVRKLREKYKFPFLKIHLHKAIPIGAGLGGGSSDGASILKAVNKFFSLKIRSEELKEIALSLGSDCPFFIENIPAFAEGRGEIMKPVKPVPVNHHLLIVSPGIAINTKAAYLDCRPSQQDTNLQEYYNRDIYEWKDLIINDFEESIFIRYPLIADLKANLYKIGALYSSLSGSGSSVYGIFDRKPDIPDSLKKYVLYSGIL